MSQQLFRNDLFDPSSAPSDPRKAALLLYAMSSEDQRWVLEQLPPAGSETLRTMLRELKELGIPADRTFLGEMVSSSQLHLDGNSTDSNDHSADVGVYLRALKHADPALLSQLLRHEPASLIARLLDVSEWGWTDAFLQHLDPARQAEIRSQRSHSVHAPGSSIKNAGQALNIHLLKHLRSRLANHQPEAFQGFGAEDLEREPPQAPPIWQRLVPLGLIRSIYHSLRYLSALARLDR